MFSTPMFNNPQEAGSREEVALQVQHYVPKRSDWRHLLQAQRHDRQPGISMSRHAAVQGARTPLVRSQGTMGSSVGRARGDGSSRPTLGGPVVRE